MEHILLVEGKDDKHVFLALLQRHFSQNPGVHIVDAEGMESLLEQLPVRLKESGLQKLGVVVDADSSSADRRWNQIRSILTESGYDSVPEHAASDGTLVRHDTKPDIGIWIMPDNNSPGMLEDFVSFLINEEDDLWSTTVRCVEDIPQEQRRFIDEHLSKAKIHTWLAWQEDPGTPLGLAITKRYLNANADSAKLLIRWLRLLFDI